MVRDPNAKDFIVEIKDGCPMVSFADKKIMEVLDQFYEQKAIRVAMVNALAPSS